MGDKPMQLGQEDDDQRVVSDGLGAAVKSATLREERSVEKSEAKESLKHV